MVSEVAGEVVPSGRIALRGFIVTRSVGMEDAVFTDLDVEIRNSFEVFALAPVPMLDRIPPRTTEKDFSGFSSPDRGSRPSLKTKKPSVFVGKPRVLTSEVDGSRTRNLRIDSPVL